MIQGMCGVESPDPPVQLVSRRYAPIIFCPTRRRGGGQPGAPSAGASAKNLGAASRRTPDVPTWRRSSCSSICTGSASTRHRVELVPPRALAPAAAALSRRQTAILGTLASHPCAVVAVPGEVGKPETTKDERLTDMAARSRNIDEVYRLAGEQLTSRSTARVDRGIRQNWKSQQVPVKSLEEAIVTRIGEEVGFFSALSHPTEVIWCCLDGAGRGFPLETRAAIDRLPPRLGEHGREILQEAGLAADEVDALAATGGVVLPGGKAASTG